MTKAIFGIFTISPCISSISLLPVAFSTAPTQRNIRDFETAWNKSSIMAAQVAAGCPTPEQAVISPRFEMVEYARTFFPSLCDIARSDAAKKVKPPTVVTMTPARFPVIRGDILIRR